MSRWRRGLPLVLLAGVLASGIAQAQELATVRVTYYTDCCVTYSGSRVAPGTAACSWGFPIGTRLRFADGREVTCLDRGQLGSGRGWVDVWMPSGADGRALAQQYGDWTTVEVR